MAKDATAGRGGQAAPETGKAPAKKKAFKKRGEKRVVHHGFAHIQASFNNTIITITDADGHVIAWSSAGGDRLQGIAQGHAVRGDPGGAWPRATRPRRTACGRVEVRVKGPGAGRESAIRALQTVGIDVKSIRDVTPIPHNGCRPPKRRRV